MTIDRLGSIDPLKNYNKTDKAAKVVKNDKADSIEVSREAKAQAELFSAREIARNAPEVRMDRVEEMKVKLQNPDYINSAILESTAEGILKSFGL